MDRIEHGRNANRNLDLQLVLDRLNLPTVTAQAKALGVCRKTVYNWRRDGIDGYIADTLCIEALGMHPIEVYGMAWVESFADEPDLLDDVDEADDSGEKSPSSVGTTSDYALAG